VRARPATLVVVDVSSVAQDMFARVVEAEQCVRVVESDADAAALRAELRRLAKVEHLSIRTARLDDTVVAVRLDAAVWRESPDVMRAKLTP
jgi:hypothetical protein